MQKNVTALSSSSPATSHDTIAATGVKTGLMAVGLTMTYALTSNSLVLWADMLATLIEFLAVVTVWLTLRKVAHTQVSSDTFGSGRMENMASLLIAQLMLASFVLIFGVAAWKIAHPVAIRGFGVYMALCCHLVYGGINGRLFWRSLCAERAEPSATLTAQRRLFFVKFMSNGLLLLALGLCLGFRRYTWAHYIDPATSVLIGVMLLLSATKTLRSSVLNLLDRALEERMQIRILRVLAEHFNDYQALHAVRTRRSGAKNHIELFLEFDPTLTMGQVQSVIERMRQRVAEQIENADVLVAPVRQAP